MPQTWSGRHFHGYRVHGTHTVGVWRCICIQPFTLTSYLGVSTLQGDTCSSVWIAINHIGRICSTKSNLRLKDPLKRRMLGPRHKPLEDHSTTWAPAGMQQLKKNKWICFLVATKWGAAKNDNAQIGRDYFWHICRKQCPCIRAGIYARAIVGANTGGCARLTQQWNRLKITWREQKHAHPFCFICLSFYQSSKGKTIKM